MNGLKVIFLLVLVNVSVYISVALTHIMLRCWSSYSSHKTRINERGLYGLRIITKFTAGFALLMFQSVASLIWELYRTDQFPLIVRLPMTVIALVLLVRSVIPINIIISGMVEFLLKISITPEAVPVHPFPSSSVHTDTIKKD